MVENPEVQGLVRSFLLSTPIYVSCVFFLLLVLVLVGFRSPKVRFPSLWDCKGVCSCASAHLYCSRHHTGALPAHILIVEASLVAVAVLTIFWLARPLFPYSILPLFLIVSIWWVAKFKIHSAQEVQEQVEKPPKSYYCNCGCNSDLHDPVSSECLAPGCGCGHYDDERK